MLPAHCKCLAPEEPRERRNGPKSSGPAGLDLNTGTPSPQSPPHHYLSIPKASQPVRKSQSGNSVLPSLSFSLSLCHLLSPCFSFYCGKSYNSIKFTISTTLKCPIQPHLEYTQLSLLSSLGHTTFVCLSVSLSLSVSLCWNPPLSAFLAVSFRWAGGSQGVSHSFPTLSLPFCVSVSVLRPICLSVLFYPPWALHFPMILSLGLCVFLSPGAASLGPKPRPGPPGPSSTAAQRHGA